MSTHKWINGICVAAVILSLLITVLCMAYASPAAVTMGYEDRLFSQDKVHSIDIVVEDWEGFLETCTNEEYINCTLVINGERFTNVGLRAKGNTSLSTVASMNSDRYSFKLEFDHYDSTKSYHGLDKLSLNNLIQDNTMMKDYLTYQLMGQMDAAAPLCSYAQISVNGEPWGMYLAVEAIEESFLRRNYGNDYGELYKPDSMSNGGGRGNGKDFNMDQWENPEENAEVRQISQGPQNDRNNGLTGEALRQALEQQGIPADSLGITDWSNVTWQDLTQQLSQLPGVDVRALQQAMMGSFSGGMRGGMGSSDVKLQYIDDDPASYSNIFDNAKTDITEADQTRLIEALKRLSSGEDLENTVDIEAVIRYFVVHTFVCNDDSYTGSMIHNYYLYEKDGKLSMLPWDYNLAFGGFQSRDASSAVNASIHSPVSGGDVSDRPMVSWIFENEEYTRLYEQYYDRLLTLDMENLVTRTAELISPYVEQDPTKFCTYEQFQTGVQTLQQFLTLRTESVRQQLNGEAGTVDTGDLNLSDMGTMGGGMTRPGNQSGGQQFPNQMPEGEGTQQFPGQMPEGEGTQQFPNQMPEGEGTQQFPGQIPGGEGSQQLPGQMPGGEGSQQFPSQMPEDQTGNQQLPGQMPEGQPGSQQLPGGRFPSRDETGSVPPEGNQPGQITDPQQPTDQTSGTAQSPGQFPGGSRFPNQTEETSQSPGNTQRPAQLPDESQPSGIIPLILFCTTLLTAAILVAFFYRRRK